MLYVICILKRDSENVELYRVFDTCSDSVMLVKPELLKSIIINTSTQVVNASIVDKNIVLKDWVNGIATEEKIFKSKDSGDERSGPLYVLLATENNICKVIVSDGRITRINKENFKILVENGEVANCSIGELKGVTKIKTEDIYKIQKDAEFEKIIASKYESFIAKTILLGYKNITFNYDIENHEVRLSRYTGLNKEVILPPFITAIMKDAFRGTGVKAIKLNHGLKVIGETAFYPGGRSTGLERVEIPESVEIVGNSVFMGNHNLANSDGTLNTQRFKLLGDKTVVLGQSL